MNKTYLVTLTKSDRALLEKRIIAGDAPARDLLHARILLKADDGPDGPAWTDADIATANLATTLGLLLNLDDQESAGVEPSTRKGPPAFSGALPLALIAADQATRPMLSAGVVFPEPSCRWAEAASARLSKSHALIHQK
jgi:hypothetical protein